MSILPVRGARQRRTLELSHDGVVGIRPISENPLAPWLIESSGDVYLAGWAFEGAPEVERLLAERGAVLFRGFGLTSAAEFEEAMGTLVSELYGGYGDLPREGSSTNIYKSTPYPADQAILFHCESSHLPTWPSRIAFFCITPSPEGGETPIVDNRELLARLDPAVAQEFEAKGLIYKRNFTGLDVSWQQFFQTDDRAEVERRCSAGGASFEWTRGGEYLRVSQPAAAVRRHPATGERLFFNEIQLHHPYYLPQTTRESLLSIIEDPEDLPRDVTFGDGTPISDEMAGHVVSVCWDTCVMFPWQQGDLMLLDNMRVAHARMPFSGERRIAVAMAGMTGA